MRHTACHAALRLVINDVFSRQNKERGPVFFFSVVADQVDLRVSTPSESIAPVDPLLQELTIV